MKEESPPTTTGSPGGSRIVLVTGGSRGIGLAVARRLQDDGDRVAVTYVQKPPADLRGPAGCNDLWPLACDVRDPEAVDATFGRIEQVWGPVEVVVASAGVTRDSLLLRMDEQSWAEVLDTNLSGVFRTVKRAVGPMVRARTGRIVLISSVAAFTGSAGQANYAAAKAGLTGFARALARELAKRDITVNVVAPGVVETDMIAGLSEKRMAELLSTVPLGRVATPREVAAAVAFLASGQASYVTGAVLAVDGGLGMGL